MARGHDHRHVGVAPQPHTDHAVAKRRRRRFHRRRATRVVSHVWRLTTLLGLPPRLNCSVRQPMTLKLLFVLIFRVRL